MAFLKPGAGLLAAFFAVAPYQAKAGALVQMPSYTQFSFDQNRVAGAPQGGIVMADADSDKNLVGSYGATSCIIVLIRRPPQTDPASGRYMPARAIAAHLDAGTNVRQLDQAMRLMGSRQPLDVTMISFDRNRELTAALNEYFTHYNVKMRSDLHGENDSAIMDVKTGAVMPDVILNDMAPKNYDPLARPEGSLKVFYDGTRRVNDLTPAALGISQPR